MHDSLEDAVNERGVEDKVAKKEDGGKESDASEAALITVSNVIGSKEHYIVQSFLITRSCQFGDCFQEVAAENPAQTFEFEINLQ